MKRLCESERLCEKSAGKMCAEGADGKKKVLMLASVASMIDQFNMPNIRLLLEMGYEVQVACNFKEGNTCDARRIVKLKKQLHRMHVGMHQWDCPRGIRSVKKCAAAYRQLRRLTEEGCYAWMHCHSPVGGALARAAAHAAGIPVVYTAHGFHFYWGAPAVNWLLYYPAEKLLSYWTDILITVNREDYCFAKRNFRAGKTCYVPGVGIDTGYFQKPDRNTGSTGVRQKYGIPQDAVLLLSVGELSRRKNHRAVLAALAGLQRSDVYYMICGQGKQKKRLVHTAAEYGILQYVRMPGYLEDVKGAYREADIFILPSYQEGLPAALMEAMASGMACAASDIRGNRELVGDAGLRFAPDDCGRLREILERLIRDKKCRDAYGEFNRKKIKDYDLSAVRRKMSRIYRRMEKKCLR